MASSAPPSDSPVLGLIDKRLCILRKKRNRILQMEESIAQGKRIKKKQEKLRRSKTFVLASIDVLEKLRPQLSAALQEELSLATQRLPSGNGREANNNAAAVDGTARGASSTHTSTESQRMDTSSSGYDYEVFLSFRGPETRSSFVNFLYTMLTRAGIHTFKDDESIRVGEEFETKISEAISQSKILIPIFTKGYASSVCCLREVAHMVKSGKYIKPIFYDVAPEVVRHQTDDYAKAFLSHKKTKRHDEGTMEEWKKALKKVADLSGWDLHNETNRQEGEFAERVTREVFIELKKANLEVSDCLVRVDNHVNAIMKKIGVLTSETRIIGVYGMGGSGKTTIAKLVYNELSRDFQHCCFLSNIREMSERKGIEFLQDQLISDVLKGKLAPIKNIHDGIRTIKERLCTKKVLLLLDDVDDKKHMDALAGDRNWFGKGSKLIITTRNKKVLEVLVKDDDFHEADGMNDVQSLQLFSKHAFKSDYPLPEYIDHSNRATSIARGLPLALEVIGSLLRHIEKEMWDATLKILESVPRDKVQSKLKISYDALDFRQKRIFLDIACLFIGHDKNILVHFWDESIFFPEEAMGVLQSMSLIKINEDNQVWMHDQLRDLGREIVREKSDAKIEKQSRVWDAKEGLNLLRRHKGKKRAEALRLKLEHQPSWHFTYEGFENLSDLRFLEVVGSRENFRAEERLLWHESPSNVPPSTEISYILPYLRWLSWSDFPPTFNIANFFVEDVVILNLSESVITYDWKGWNHMKVMKNLKVLNLSNCYELRRFPDSIGNLHSLIELDISRTCIKILPDSIGNLGNLKKLKMQGSAISKISDALWMIEKLEEIEVSKFFGNFHVNIGNCIHKNQSLRILKLAKAYISALPRLPESLVTLRLVPLYMDTFPDLSNLTNLKELHLEFESRDSHEESDGPLEEYPMPWWIGNLSKLQSLYLRCPFLTTSPADLTLPPQLKELYLHGCRNLACLPRLPSSLSSLRLECCQSLCSMGDLSNLKNLLSLNIWDSAIEGIEGLGCLENLRDLVLERLPKVTILHNLSNLSKLRSLYVHDCDNLIDIQGELPRFLDELDISSCDSLQNLPDLSSLMGKQRVFIQYCRKLNVEAIHGVARVNPPDY